MNPSPIPTTTAAPPSIAILLATYQGERYLPEQLDSFARQTHGNWKAWASDDGSTDSTVSILQRYQAQWAPGQLTIMRGPAQGSSRNFTSLTHSPTIQADYYAYSDQDDIWEDDKLARALAWLTTQEADKPALYCTRTRLVDAQNREIGLSPNYQRPPSFANALMQNITGGNTMVFNDAARRLLCSVPADTEIVIHDWWTYLVVTACGGTVRFDSQPGLRYRQHDNNLIGLSVQGPSLGTRTTRLFGAAPRRDVNTNLKTLQALWQHITPDNQRTVELFAYARGKPLLPRLIGYKKAGIYKLTCTGNIGLAIAAIFNLL